MHVDSQYTGDKEWNFIGPNVILQNDELDRARVYQYEYGVAPTVEDNTRHINDLPAVLLDSVSLLGIPMGDTPNHGL